MSIGKKCSLSLEIPILFSSISKTIHKITFKNMDARFLSLGFDEVTNCFIQSVTSAVTISKTGQKKSINMTKKEHDTVYHSFLLRSALVWNKCVPEIAYYSGFGIKQNVLSCH